MFLEIIQQKKRAANFYWNTYSMPRISLATEKSLLFLSFSKNNHQRVAREKCWAYICSGLQSWAITFNWKLVFRKGKVIFQAPSEVPVAENDNRFRWKEAELLDNLIAESYSVLISILLHFLYLISFLFTLRVFAWKIITLWNSLKISKWYMALPSCKSSLNSVDWSLLA